VNRQQRAQARIEERRQFLDVPASLFKGYKRAYNLLVAALLVEFLWAVGPWWHLPLSIFGVVDLASWAFPFVVLFFASRQIRGHPEPLNKRPRARVIRIR
jgi:hypothetical protein